MAHECPECGQQCYCDGEDHGQPAPEDCRHCPIGVDVSEDEDE